MTSQPGSTDVFRVANCSGFYGDRLSAAREMVMPRHPEARPIDCLTGDYLAELTMMILLKDRNHEPGGGYARTFPRQLSEVAAACAHSGIKIVTNAGGLNPAGCAAACRGIVAGLELAADLQSRLLVAHIEGDDILQRLGDLQQRGEEIRHLDRDQPLSELASDVLSANVYLGAWGIVTALSAGAGIVVCPRVTDASVVVGPTAWRFGWQRDDWDQLAGAVVAGHVIECGTQCTGGNYSFFTEMNDALRPGFPIAEMHADGSFVISKHPGTGGQVSIGTVTAQLLYEIQSERYLNPDVVVRLDTIRIEQEGRDRVRVWGVRGEPAPDKLKVCLNAHGGFKNSLTLMVPGLDHEQKARLAEEQFFGFLAGPEAWKEIESGEIGRDGEAGRAGQVHLDGGSKESPQSRTPAMIGRARFAQTAAHFRPGDPFSLLTLAARDSDQKALSRGFWNAAIEMALAGYPGFHIVQSSREAAEITVYWPALVSREFVSERVLIPASPHRTSVSERIEDDMLVLEVVGSSPSQRVGVVRPPIEPVPIPKSSDAEFYRAEATAADPAFRRALTETQDVRVQTIPEPPGSGQKREPLLGDFLGARSGDKGGNCNVGFWARSVPAYQWMLEHLTPESVRRITPEAAELRISRYELPGLLAVNFVIEGLLGEGVSASLRPDPQAKMVGEEMRRARVSLFDG